MPEGPEVKLMSEGLQKYCEHCCIQNIEIIRGRYIKHGSPEGFSKCMEKLPLRMVKVTSKGKGIFIQLEKNTWIYNTLGMSGSWTHLFDKYCNLKFVLHDTSTQTQKVVYFRDIRNFGHMKFLHQVQDLEKIQNRWGPDIQLETTDLELFCKRTTRYCHKNVTQVLMSQNIISGIGNYIKAEALYRAKISPHRNWEQLTETEIATLFQELKKIVKTSYQLQGNTIRTHQNFGGKEGNFSDLLQVYMKKICPAGFPVKTIKTLDKRTTHWVPEIQK